MTRSLPPLSALRAFEAAARHGSFKRAAAELTVTPTAISHQVRSLEEHTGLALFERQTRKVVLTDAGAQLFPVLRDGFDAFAAIVARLTERPRRDSVTISATIAFTARWLVPRVASFVKLHPDIDLQLHASDAPEDLAHSRIDLAVRYGRGPYPGLVAEPLFTDHYAPVANPLLRVRSPADLGKVPRIAFAWTRKLAENPTWQRWFAAAGVREPRSAELRFSDESHAMQAAVAGQGVALVSLALVAEDLEAGRVVQPFGPALPGHTYHLVSRGNSAAARAVVGWIRAEIDEARAREESRA